MSKPMTIDEEIELIKKAGATLELADIFVSQFEKCKALEAENASLKARCTWKPALKEQPPLGPTVLAFDDFSGATRATFMIENGRLYYSNPRGNMWFLVNEKLLWTDMPDFPEPPHE